MLNHNFKKKFGQNFLSDKNLLAAIVQDAGVGRDDDVLEIGAGGGNLTEFLSQNARKVVSYEIDKDLQEHLMSLGLKNTTFKFADIMKCDIQEIEDDFQGKYRVVANLPYYITTPIIFKFLTRSSKVCSLTIMVQKEVAERIVAGCGNKDYGVLSVMVNFYGHAKITRYVSRKMFYPQPNVDSAVVHIDIENKHSDIDRDKFYTFIQGCFSMRRKTFKNNLAHAFKIKGEILDSLLTQDMLVRRPESFSLDNFIEIYNKIKNFI